MVKRIDLFQPTRSQYGCLHHQTQKMYEALNRIGVSCRLLEADPGNPKAFIQTLLDDPPDCTLSFNGLLPDQNGTFFCDSIGIPHVAYLMDSPNNFFSLVNSPNTIIACVDKFFCDFFREIKSTHVIFLPHGVERELENAPEEERIYDVVMPSSFIDFEGVRDSWKDTMSPALYSIMEDAIEKDFLKNDTMFIQAFLEALRVYDGKKGLLDPQQVNFVYALNELEKFIKGRGRIELLKSITDVPVHVFGSVGDLSAWQKYFGQKDSNIILKDPLPLGEVMRVMRQSKIVLNSCATFKNGPHDRILASLLSGALPLTAENIYMREHFSDGENIILYNHREMGNVNAKVLDYLSDEEKRRQVVTKGRQLVAKEHTWDQRVTTLVELLDPILA